MQKPNTMSARLLAILMALVMTLSVCVMPGLAVSTDEPAAPVATFENISDDGADQIILTTPRTFKAMIPVTGDVDPATVTWTMPRDTEKVYVDIEMYPNQTMGGDLSTWTAGNKQPLFSEITTTVEEVDGQKYVVAQFSNICYFYSRNVADPSAPHANGGAYLDPCGYFNLTAMSGETELGSVPVKIAPYDNFHTMDEIYAELDAMVEFAAENTDLYVEQFSMGQSSGVFYEAQEMPYLIVAKDRAAVDNWLAIAHEAETDPSALLAKLESGELTDYQVPVLYSNVHANEVAAADGIIRFAWNLLETAASETGNIDYTNLTGFTAEGEAELAAQLEKDGVVVPDLVKDTATYLGYIKGEGLRVSGVVDMDKYYTSETVTVNVDELLEDVFFLIVPEENVDGRAQVTRHSSNGYDLNRDNSFQTTAETQNMTHFIGTWNPVSFTEFHGRVQQYQCEPCDPPHEPNFEYDLLAEHLVTGGEAYGIAAVANNDGYNSYVMPQRDYLYEDESSPSGASWSPWDDMSTSYTPQFAMLHGTVSYTVELPAYNDHTATSIAYGALGQSNYIAANKAEYLTAQTKIYERGVTNANSNAYELVGQWFCDQYDIEGAEMDLFRPIYDGEGQNGNFYPECYIIPLDGKNQSNLQAANDMMEWLSRNDVKILITEDAVEYDGVTYPAGTMVVSMYQAKRSVANGALYDGTLIQQWSDLYSEGITTFNETRGFDMAVCAEPEAYKTIAAACGEMMDYDACLAYLAENAASYFSGPINQYVVISNASEDSTAAVNALLKNGAEVGMVTDTESKFYGDFICSFTDWKTVRDEYVITGTGVAYRTAPAAQLITAAPLVYINGASADNATGFIYSSRVSNSTWNYDRLAMEMMNFDVTTDAAEADAIVGASTLRGDALAAVQAGTPYIGYGSSAARSTVLGSALVRSSASGMDCLPYVTYPTTNLINASYVMDNDDVLYGYGVGYFSAIPEGAEILVQVDGTRTPTEGFLQAISEKQQETSAAYLNNSIQGIAYKGADKDGNQVNVAFFANTLTNKVHQRDEYAFISNFIFSNMLGDEMVYQAPASGGTSGGATGTPVTPVTPVEPADPAEPAVSFSDVSGHWAEAAINDVVSKGLFNGVSETEFAPAATTTRGMIMTVLARMDGVDTTGSAPWYKAGMDWAVANGISDGTNPEGTITREQLAVMLYRYEQYKGGGFTGAWAFQLDFTDVAQLSDWAYEGMCWCVMNEIIGGKGNGTLDPQGLATRAEVATMMSRFIAE